jgi:hypothetical protein
VSCYLDNGATTATTFFGSVPQDLSNSNGLLSVSVSVSSSNKNSNFWLHVLGDVAEEVAEEVAENPEELAA